MGRRARPLDAVAKHLTREEIQAREAAEEAVMPARALDPAKPPRRLLGDPEARKLWKWAVESTAGLGILELLDTETLAVWCSMTSRWTALNKRRLELQEAGEDTAEEAAELRATEKTLLSYADKLGLTPAGRAQLARRLAAADADRPPDELFGD